MSFFDFLKKIWAFFLFIFGIVAFSSVLVSILYFKRKATKKDLEKIDSIVSKYIEVKKENEEVLSQTRQSIMDTVENLLKKEKIEIEGKARDRRMSFYIEGLDDYLH